MLAFTRITIIPQKAEKLTGQIAPIACYPHNPVKLMKTSHLKYTITKQPTHMLIPNLVISQSGTDSKGCCSLIHLFYHTNVEHFEKQKGKKNNDSVQGKYMTWNSNAGKWSYTFIEPTHDISVNSNDCNSLHNLSTLLVLEFKLLRFMSWLQFLKTPSTTHQPQKALGCFQINLML